MGTRLEESELEALIAERMGDHDGTRVHRAARAVVEAMAERLPAADVSTLADELPRAWLGSWNESGRLLASVDCFSEVAMRAEMSEAGAHEYAFVVAQVLGAHVSPATLALLLRHLPAPWPGLLAPREHDASTVVPPHRAASTGERHTIANGRPGSLQPVIEVTSEPAQAASIARDDEPHRDTKLSSGAPHTGRHGV